MALPQRLRSMKVLISCLNIIFLNQNLTFFLSLHTQTQIHVTTSALRLQSATGPHNDITEYVNIINAIWHQLQSQPGQQPPANEDQVNQLLSMSQYRDEIQKRLGGVGVNYDENQMKSMMMMKIQEQQQQSQLTVHQNSPPASPDKTSNPTTPAAQTQTGTAVSELINSLNILNLVKAYQLVSQVRTPADFTQLMINNEFALFRPPYDPISNPAKIIMINKLCHEYGSTSSFFSQANRYLMYFQKPGNYVEALKREFSMFQNTIVDDSAILQMQQQGWQYGLLVFKFMTLIDVREPGTEHIELRNQIKMQIVNKYKQEVEQNQIQNAPDITPFVNDLLNSLIPNPHAIFIFGGQFIEVGIKSQWRHLTREDKQNLLHHLNESALPKLIHYVSDQYMKADRIVVNNVMSANSNSSNPKFNQIQNQIQNQKSLTKRASTDLNLLDGTSSENALFKLANTLSLLLKNLMLPKAEAERLCKATLLDGASRQLVSGGGLLPSSAYPAPLYAEISMRIFSQISEDLFDFGDQIINEKLVGLRHEFKTQTAPAVYNTAIKILEGFVQQQTVIRDGIFRHIREQFTSMTTDRNGNSVKSVNQEALNNFLHMSNYESETGPFNLSLNSMRVKYDIFNYVVNSDHSIIDSRMLLLMGAVDPQVQNQIQNSQHQIDTTGINHFNHLINSFQISPTTLYTEKSVKETLNTLSMFWAMSSESHNEQTYNQFYQVIDAFWGGPGNDNIASSSRFMRNIIYKKRDEYIRSLISRGVNMSDITEEKKENILKQLIQLEAYGIAVKNSAENGAVTYTLDIPELANKEETVMPFRLQVLKCLLEIAKEPHKKRRSQIQNQMMAYKRLKMKIIYTFSSNAENIGQLVAAKEVARRSGQNVNNYNDNDFIELIDSDYMINEFANFATGSNGNSSFNAFYKGLKEKVANSKRLRYVKRDNRGQMIEEAKLPLDTFDLAGMLSPANGQLILLSLNRFNSDAQQFLRDIGNLPDLTQLTFVVMGVPGRNGGKILDNSSNVPLPTTPSPPLIQTKLTSEETQTFLKFFTYITNKLKQESINIEIGLRANSGSSNSREFWIEHTKLTIDILIQFLSGPLLDEILNEVNVTKNLESYGFKYAIEYLLDMTQKISGSEGQKILRRDSANGNLPTDIGKLDSMTIISLSEGVTILKDLVSFWEQFLKRLVESAIHVVNFNRSVFITTDSDGASFSNNIKPNSNTIYPIPNCDYLLKQIAFNTPLNLSFREFIDSRSAFNTYNRGRNSLPEWDFLRDLRYSLSITMTKPPEMIENENNTQVIFKSLTNGHQDVGNDDDDDSEGEDLGEEDCGENIGRIKIRRAMNYGNSSTSASDPGASDVSDMGRKQRKADGPNSSSDSNTNSSDNSSNSIQAETLELSLFRKTQNTLFYASQIDPYSTGKMLRDLMHQQRHIRNWSVNDLDVFTSFCHAIGSISGSMNWNTEKIFFEAVLNNMFDMVKYSNDIKHKANITSEIIYLNYRYLRFLKKADPKNNEYFKTVLRKLKEWMNQQYIFESNGSGDLLDDITSNEGFAERHLLGIQVQHFAVSSMNRIFQSFRRKNVLAINTLSDDSDDGNTNDESRQLLSLYNTLDDYWKSEIIGSKNTWDDHLGTIVTRPSKIEDGMNKFRIMDLQTRTSLQFPRSIDEESIIQYYEIATNFIMGMNVELVGSVNTQNNMNLMVNHDNNICKRQFKQVVQNRLILHSRNNNLLWFSGFGRSARIHQLFKDSLMSTLPIDFQTSTLNSSRQVENMGRIFEEIVTGIKSTVISYCSSTGQLQNIDVNTAFILNQIKEIRYHSIIASNKEMQARQQMITAQQSQPGSGPVSLQQMNAYCDQHKTPHQRLFVKICSSDPDSFLYTEKLKIISWYLLVLGKVASVSGLAFSELLDDIYENLLFLFQVVGICGNRNVGQDIIGSNNNQYDISIHAAFGNKYSDVLFNNFNDDPSFSASRTQSEIQLQIDLFSKIRKEIIDVISNFLSSAVPDDLTQEEYAESNIFSTYNEYRTGEYIKKYIEASANMLVAANNSNPNQGPTVTINDLTVENIFGATDLIQRAAREAAGPHNNRNYEVDERELEASIDYYDSDIKNLKITQYSPVVNAKDHDPNSNHDKLNIELPLIHLDGLINNFGFPHSHNFLSTVQELQNNIFNKLAKNIHSLIMTLYVEDPEQNPASLNLITKLVKHLGSSEICYEGGVREIIFTQAIVPTEKIILGKVWAESQVQQNSSSESFQSSSASDGVSNNNNNHYFNNLDILDHRNNLLDLIAAVIDSCDLRVILSNPDYVSILVTALMREVQDKEHKKSGKALKILINIFRYLNSNLLATKAFLERPVMENIIKVTLEILTDGTHDNTQDYQADLLQQIFRLMQNVSNSNEPTLQQAIHQQSAIFTTFFQSKFPAVVPNIQIATQLVQIINNNVSTSHGVGFRKVIHDLLIRLKGLDDDSEEAIEYRSRQHKIQNEKAENVTITSEDLELL